MMKKIFLLLFIFVFLAFSPQIQIFAEDNDTYYTVELNSISKDGKNISNGVAQVSGLPLGGLVEANKDYSFTAFDNDLYEFSYWEVDGVRQNNSSNILTGSYNKDSVVNAVYSFKGESELLLSVVGRKPFSVKTIEGTTQASEDQGTYTYTESFESFASIELIYEDNDGDFVAWTNSCNVLSNNTTYGFKITSDTNIKLTTYEAGHNTYLAELYNTSGKFVATCEFDDDVDALLEQISQLSTPSRIGYDFDCWLLGNMKINSSTQWSDISSKLDNNKITLTASYKKGEEKATITIIKRIDEFDQDSPKAEEVRIGDVTKLVASVVKDKSFVCWAIKEKEEYVPITTNSTCLFHVVEDETIYAMYSSININIDEKASVGVSNVVSEDLAGGKNRIFFEVNRYVPADASLTGHGIIYSSYDFSSMSDSDISNAIMFDDNGVLKDNLKAFTGENLDKNNSFGVHLNVGEQVNTNVYFRGYIIVDGEVSYTPIYVGSYNRIKEHDYDVISYKDYPSLKKGDLISFTYDSEILYSGLNYKVINVRENYVELLALFTMGENIDPFDSNINYPYYYDDPGVMVETTLFNGYSSIKYEGSSLDKFHSDDNVSSEDDPIYGSELFSYCFYFNLPQEMKNAIVPNIFTQKLYDYSYDEGNNDFTYRVEKGNGEGVENLFYMGSASPIERTAYALGIDDVYEYYGKNIITSSELNDFFGYHNDNGERYFWLNSAYIHTEDQDTSYGAWEYHYFDNNGVAEFNPDDTYWRCSNQPAFVIDLLGEGLDYTIGGNVDASVTYKNASGEEQTISFPLDTEVVIDKGKHGNYQTEPGSITLTSSNNKLDLTAAQYTPTADTGFTFVGFVYDSEINTFTAKYTYDNAPEKGEFIKINDGNSYIVLSVDESDVKVVCVSDDSTIEYNNPSKSTTFGDNNYSGEDYNDSLLDNYLNTTWFGDLDSNIKNAIKQSPVSQSMYLFCELDDENDMTDDEGNEVTYRQMIDEDYYGFILLGTNNIGNRYVYSLGLEDLYELYDTDLITPEILQSFIPRSFLSDDYFYWLSSTPYDDEMCAFSIYMDYDEETYAIDSSGVATDFIVLPVFVLDISSQGVEVTTIQ